MATYTKFINDWVSWPSTLTPVSAAFLDYLEDSLTKIYDEIPLSTENLNAVMTPGSYVQTSTGNATSGRNYPVNNGAGHLFVQARVSSPSVVLQTFTVSSSTSATMRRFWRTYVSSTWGPWVEVPKAGLPAGGSAATFLKKNTGTDYDVSWAALAAADITDFSETVDDRIAALLVEGSGIDLTYNDGANTLTIASTGGSGVGFITPPLTIEDDRWAYVNPYNRNTQTTAVGATGGHITGFPFSLARQITVDQFAVEVTTAAGAGTTERWAIYTATAGGPVTLVVDSGTFLTDSTGVKTVTPGSSVVMPAGNYAFVMGRPSAGGANFRAVDTTSASLPSDAAFSGMTGGWQLATSGFNPATAWPASAPWTPSGVQTRHHVLLAMHITAVA